MNVDSRFYYWVKRLDTDSLEITNSNSKKYPKFGANKLRGYKTLGTNKSIRQIKIQCPLPSWFMKDS